MDRIEVIWPGGKRTVHENVDVDRLVVAEATVGKGLVMKRWRARARGRVARIHKPFSQITLVVREQGEA